MLVYEHKDEWRLELGEDGSVFVRRLGGPIHYMGHVHNNEPSAVSGWRARIPPARRDAILAGIEEAGSQNVLFNLVPDERASGLRVGGTSWPIVHRALEANVALDRVVAELCSIAAALMACAPTDRLAPNPERDQWSLVPPDQRYPAPEAPAVPPGAAEQAQAAVDRFYATGLAGVLGAVAARSRPNAAKEPEVPLGDAEHTFTCRATGKPAGKVSLRLTSGAGTLSLTGFSPTSDHSVGVSQKELRTAHRDLLAGNAHALWDRDLGLAPFYCRDCKANFAASEWQIYETSPTRIEGTCPSGHRRRMHAK